MANLSNLSSVGNELTTQQLDEVDGGLVPIIIGGLVLLDIYIWGKVYDKYSN